MERIIVLGPSVGVGRWNSDAGSKVGIIRLGFNAAISGLEPSFGLAARGH